MAPVLMVSLDETPLTGEPDARDGPVRFGGRIRPKEIPRFEPLNLIEWSASVSGRSVTALPLWRVPIFGTAREGDWFRSSARVLFGDAVCAAFPLGRLVLL